MKTILITTYSPCIHASYGIVSKEIFERIFPKNKYRLIHHAWLHANPAVKVPWQIIPTKTKEVNGKHELLGSDIHGQESFKELMAHFKPDIVWALGDFYMLQHVFIEKKNFPNTKFIGYIAVDGQPWTKLQVDNLKYADKLYGITKFGAKTIGNLLGKELKHIWHGVNLDKLYQTNPEDKKSLRSEATRGVLNEESFVAGFVGKNQYRKQNDKFWEYLHYMIHGDYIVCKDCQRITLKEWDSTTGKSKSPEDITMYDPGYDYSFCQLCNSVNIEEGKPNDNFYGYLHMPYKIEDSWNPDLLSEIWKVRGKIFNTSNITSERGLDDDKMVSIYSMFDIMYYPSGGEGFGMPVLEAMACGVPVMYTNYSGHAEVAKDCGIPIKCDYVTESMSCYNRARANTADAVMKTLMILNDRKILTPIIEAGLERAKQNTWDIIAKQWEDEIDELAQETTQILGVSI